MKRLIFAFSLIAACGTIQAFAHDLDFNYHDVSMSALKLGIEHHRFETKAVSTDQLVAYFMPNFYQNESNNEFAMHGVRPEAVKKAKEALRTASATGPYVIRTNMSFGKYNFASHKFPLDGLNRRTYFYVRGSSVSGGPWPAFEYDIFFNNPDIAATLPMSEKKAAAFIQSRTQYGMVNRSVYAVITMSIKRFKNTTLSTSPESTQQLIAHIDSIRLYGSQNERHLLYTYR